MAAEAALLVAPGDIVMVNRQTELLFGYERQVLVGQPVELLLPEALREAHRLLAVALARTAKLLVEAGQVPEQPALRAEEPGDQGLVVEQTAWGQAHRVLAPLTISGTP